MVTIAHGFTVSWETDAAKSLLILTRAGLKRDLIDYQVEMLARNRIPGVAGLTVREKDGEVKLCYDLTGLVRLVDSCSRKTAEPAAVLDLFARLTAILLESRNYLLDSGSFLLEPDYLLKNPAGREIYLIYLPVETETEPGRMFKALVTGLLADRRIAALPDYWKRQIEEALAAEPFSLSRFSRQIREIKNGIDDPVFIPDLAAVPPEQDGGREGRWAAPDPEPANFSLAADRPFLVEPERQADKPGTGLAAFIRRLRGRRETGEALPPEWDRASRS